MLKRCFVLLLTLICFNLQSQEKQPSDSLQPKINKALIFYGLQKADSTTASLAAKPKVKQKGYLKIKEEDSLNLLIAGYKDQKQTEGYKIQIFSGKSKLEAIKVKSSFDSKYGETDRAEIVYQQPNFKIRIGNYRDRLDANKWLGVYKVDFPSSFIVKDVIKIDQSKN